MFQSERKDRKGKTEKGKYKFSQEDHVNKILLCWWFVLIVSENPKKNIEKEMKSKRIVNDCELSKGSTRFQRLTYSDGFLMNQQI